MSQRRIQSKREIVFERSGVLVSPSTFGQLLKYSLDHQFPLLEKLPFLFEIILVSPDEVFTVHIPAAIVAALAGRNQIPKPVGSAFTLWNEMFEREFRQCDRESAVIAKASLLRWLNVRREYPWNNEPEPKPFCLAVVDAAKVRRYVFNEFFRTLT